jgi:hypothetical protein
VYLLVNHIDERKEPEEHKTSTSGCQGLATFKIRRVTHCFSTRDSFCDSPSECLLLLYSLKCERFKEQFFSRARLSSFATGSSSSFSTSISAILSDRITTGVLHAQPCPEAAVARSFVCVVVHSHPNLGQSSKLRKISRNWLVSLELQQSTAQVLAVDVPTRKPQHALVRVLAPAVFTGTRSLQVLVIDRRSRRTSSRQMNSIKWQFGFKFELDLI